MKRSERMAPVQRVLGSAERSCARDVGSAQKIHQDAMARLQNLREYHAEYLSGFEQCARGGQSVTALRNYQQFLARLEEALRQQEQVVAQAADAVAGSREKWQQAARQVKAVETVVGRWQHDEKRQLDRLEQKGADERAQRTGGIGAMSTATERK